MQAFELKNLEPSDVAVGSILPNSASVIHYGTYELLVQHQSIPDGETTALIHKWAEYPESLGCSLSNLVYVISPDKTANKGYP